MIKQEAWERVYRAGFDARVFRCRNCGAESINAYEIAMEMVVCDPQPRRRCQHKCKECGAPMPWCDERTYHTKPDWKP